MWLTAAIGLAIGGGHVWLAIVVTATARSILYVVALFTTGDRHGTPSDDHTHRAEAGSTDVSPRSER